MSSLGDGHLDVKPFCPKCKYRQRNRNATVCEVCGGPVEFSRCPVHNCGMKVGYFLSMDDGGILSLCEKHIEEVGHLIVGLPSRPVVVKEREEKK